jgi:lysophospholipase L1-like esterase
VAAGTWVVMGSSTAAGAGATPGKSWVDLLQLDLAGQGAQFANIAKGGTVTYQGLSAADTPVPGRPLPDAESNIDQALSLDPVLLIVAYPTNDTALGYSVGETVGNILAIRSHALASSVPVIVVSTQPRDLSAEKLARLPLIDEDLGVGVGPCFVEVRSALADENGHLAAQYDVGDGVHPNDEGHLLIAARIRAVLDSGRCVLLPGE